MFEEESENREGGAQRNVKNCREKEKSPNVNFETFIFICDVKKFEILEITHNVFFFLH
jgi:hypothetical protein